jgi:hypothetical protein
MELLQWAYFENISNTNCFDLDTPRSLGEIAQIS